MQELDALSMRQQQDFAAVLQENPALGAALARQPALATELPRLWLASDYAAGLCTGSPAILVDLVQSADLTQGYADWSQHLAAYLQRLDCQQHDMLARVRYELRCFRKREMLRILWRDVSGRAALMDTCRDLSLLADTCIRYALAELAPLCRQQHGMPLDSKGAEQQLIVLAMGKHGAFELNLSSDIDLIFVFPEDGETTVTPEWQAAHPQCRDTTIQQYFSKLGQLLISALDPMTGDGFVFRVDMRLRPYGTAGALALSIDAMEEYYQTQGRDWERFAMIKVRAVTGDITPVNRLTDILRGFSYRRYLDFATIASLRDLKHQIEQQVRRKGMTANIKLGRGGIREIEFIVQVLQLIYGGRLKQLQSPSILAAFDALVLEQCMQPADAAVLRDSYFFLRKLEHAIQGLEDKQTHNYPQDPLSELRIARTLGYETGAALRAALDRVRDQVAANFADLIADTDTAAQATPDTAMTDVWQGTLDRERALKVLAERGYRQPEELLRQLETYRASRQFLTLEKNSRERIDRFLPLLLTRVSGETDPDLGFARVFIFVQAVAQRTAYLVLLLENPVALSQLITLCSASPWVAELLTRYPVLLDELLRPLSTPPDKPQLQDLLRQQLLRSTSDALDEQLAGLQNFRQEQMLTVAAAELAGTMPLMKVSDYLTWLAEVVIGHVLELAWQQLRARYGEPCNGKGERGGQDFIVIGYGKLGSIELNYGSDLDLVFMHDGHAELETSGGSSGTIVSSAFYVQLGQKFLSLLGTHTLSGKLYEIDMRLRPSGASGALVCSREAFHRYQSNDAWTWEHQALIRARVVAGSSTLTADFEGIRAEVLARVRDPARLGQDIVNMRLRMRRELGSKRPTETFQMKQDAGGLVDIEFIVQYLVLNHACKYPALLQWTDNMRLLDTAAACGVLPAEDAKTLQTIYIRYRTLLHHLALEKAAYLRPAEEFQEERAQVTAIWERLFAAFAATPAPATGAPELP